MIEKLNKDNAIVESGDIDKDGNYIHPVYNSFKLELINKINEIIEELNRLSSKV